ncbi:MAG: hypothetical protein LBL49_04940 [Clostridiales Family XIII bacterium]|nr:hypothetical protein [Clostridiales Family XIII bacterium]
MPQEYKSRVILKSGICLPTIAIGGQVAGIWNIKKNVPIVEFFNPQPKRTENAALERVESIIRRTRGGGKIPPPLIGDVNGGSYEQKEKAFDHNRCSYVRADVAYDIGQSD